MTMTDQEFEIAIEVKQTDKMFVKVAIGEGVYDGVDFSLSSVVGSGHPILRFDGKQFVLDLQSFVRQVMDREYSKGRYSVGDG